MLAFQLTEMLFTGFEKDVSNRQLLRAFNFRIQIGEGPSHLRSKCASDAGLARAHETYEIDSLHRHDPYRLTQKAKGSTSAVESFGHIRRKRETMSFQDKVAIVTGGSRGIGRAIVRALAAEGARVAFTYVQNKALADEVAQGDSIVAYQADVTSFEQAKDLVKQIKERFGRIDILVNNAGITRDKLILRMSEKDWDDVIDTNLKGAFNLTKPVVAAMVSQRSGTILNITSISGIVGMPGQTNYSSSKAGMIGFTKALAKEIAKANITVNALALGFVETDMTAALNEEYRARALEQIPLGRIGKPENMADVAMFLLSDKANYITGQVIQVDGGLAI